MAAPSEQQEARPALAPDRRPLAGHQPPAPRSPGQYYEEIKAQK